MADKKRIQRYLRQLRHLKTWQLLILLILASFISATLLRLNNIGMIQRREAVLTSDKTADTVQIRNRLADLQQYTAHHMNANTGPFYLDGQYKADVQKAIAEASAASGVDNVIAKADAACKARFSGYSMQYTLCIADEQAKAPPSQLQNSAKLPNSQLYKREFTSPLISFDLAGLSVLVCLFIILLIFARMVAILVLRSLLRRHYRSL